jgi:hypothetical protein
MGPLVGVGVPYKYARLGTEGHEGMGRYERYERRRGVSLSAEGGCEVRRGAVTQMGARRCPAAEVHCP